MLFRRVKLNFFLKIPILITVLCKRRVIQFRNIEIVLIFVLFL